MYGYEERIRSMTMGVRSKNASSMDAFSGE